MTNEKPFAAALAAFAAMALAAAPLAAGQFVWWEGERPQQTNFPQRSSFSASTFQAKRDVLSGGDWLTSGGKRGGEELTAVYRVAVPAPGKYGLWARKFWKHGPFRWRFDEGPLQTCGRDVALSDNADIRTHLCVNWVFLGEVDLPAGERTFELRLLAGPGENATACFDCFCLIDGPFLPNGKLKPGEKSGLADEGFFPFEPGLDAFGGDAMLDLRSLSEPQAGRDGRVRRDGDSFVLGGGRPVRFWAVNLSAENAGQSRQAVDYLARRLAKLGVNMVRYHSPLFESRADATKVSPRRLDDLHYLVAAMARQGIYTTISFHFPLWLEGGSDVGLAGYDRPGNKKTFAVLFFEPRMQEIYRAWARALLTTPNPYAGAPLGRDPAVAIVEVVNEDSYFFWTFTRGNAPQPYWRKLEGIYGQWLAGRYGSLEKGLAAWGDDARHADDAPEAGRAAMLDAWNMTRDGLANKSPGRRRRVADQVRFLAGNQRAFYESTIAQFRQLGYEGIVSCSNWQTADPAVLDLLERWTYTAGDVIDRHGYFGGPHSGEGASYSVRRGHAYSDRAAATSPEALPIQVHQVAGYPHIITELGWTNPNRYRADCTFLASAYGALQGLDGVYFFAVGSDYLLDGAMSKFALSCPVIAGTFPAAALMYRRGDVPEAATAFGETLNLEDLFALKGSAVAQAPALDALRQADVPARRRARPADSALDPLAFYVGRVTRSISGTANGGAEAGGGGGTADGPPGAEGDGGKATNPGMTEAAAKCIDRQGKTVRSLGGELAWDFGRGIVTVNTPRAQGAAGFLSKAGTIELGDVSITCGNEYAAILVVSLDDKPLASSARILIQAMTEERPYGFRTADGKITDLGGAPFGVRLIDAKVTLRAPAAPTTGAAPPAGGRTVTALDANGYAAARRVETTASPGKLTISLAPDAIYHIIGR